MDGKGMQKINSTVRNLGEVESSMSPEDEQHIRFFSIVSPESSVNTRSDPSCINEALDGAGLMHHEGHGVRSYTPSPLLKYLGSNGAYHAYEDVASK